MQYVGHLSCRSEPPTGATSIIFSFNSKSGCCSLLLLRQSQTQSFKFKFNTFLNMIFSGFFLFLLVDIVVVKSFYFSAYACNFQFFFFLDFCFWSTKITRGVTCSANVLWPSHICCYYCCFRLLLRIKYNVFVFLFVFFVSLAYFII